MPENRFYVSQGLAEGTKVVLSEEEAHHLFVMRAQVGETVELVNGQGQLALATVIQLKKTLAEVELTEVETEAKAAFQLILAQALPRLSRLDVILEKGTELGVTNFWLFPAAQSEKQSLSSHQLNRIDNILIASLKQCGRLYLPKISLSSSLMQWDSLPFPTYFGDLRQPAPPLQKAWERHPPKEGAIFVVGPEKGLTQSEIAHLENLGAQGVTLHRNILRTDTAPLAALSLMSHFMLMNASFG